VVKVSAVILSVNGNYVSRDFAADGVIDAQTPDFSHSLGLRRQGRFADRTGAGQIVIE
jgi:hypothetical protein